MKLFKIPKGTEVRCIRDGVPWFSGNFREHVTKEDQLFDVEEVCVDPVGNLGTNRTHGNMVGAAYARNGWYGFRRDGWVLLVPSSLVQMM